MTILKKIKTINFINLGMHAGIASSLLLTNTLSIREYFSLTLPMVFLLENVRNYFILHDDRKRVRTSFFSNYPSSLLNTIFFIKDLNSTTDNEVKKAKILFTSYWLNIKQHDNDYFINPLLKKEINKIIKSCFNDSFNVNNFFSSVNFLNLNPLILNSIVINDDTQKEYNKFFNDTSILIPSIQNSSNFKFCLSFQNFKLFKQDIELLNDLVLNPKKIQLTIQCPDHIDSAEHKDSIINLIDNNLEHIHLLKNFFSLINIEDSIKNHIIHYIDKIILFNSLTDHINLIPSPDKPKQTNKI